MFLFFPLAGIKIISFYYSILHSQGTGFRAPGRAPRGPGAATAGKTGPHGSASWST
jgi:hypothetical protein